MDNEIIVTRKIEHPIKDIALDTLVFCFFSSILLYVAMASFVAIVSGEWFALFGLVGLGLSVAAWIYLIKFFCERFIENAKEFFRQKKIKQKLFSDGYKKERREVIIYFCVISIVFFTLFGSLLVISHVETQKNYEKAKVLFEDAVQLLSEDDYNAALVNFTEISSYKLEHSEFKNVDAYIGLCDALVEYKKNYSTGYKMLNDVQFEALSDKEELLVEQLKEKFTNDYTKRKEEYQKKVHEDYLKSLKNGIPIHGMSSKYINMTSLGKAARVVREDRVDSETKEDYFVDAYYFEKNGKKIYRVDCANGVVVAVVRYVESTSSSSSSSSSKGSSSSKDDDDPYNAKDYSNEEDFYDDHYDDFFDYYDAEDYYREHHD